MSRAVATALSLLVLLAGALPVAASDEAALDDAPLVGEIVPGEVVVGWRNPDRGAIVLRARGLALVTELGHRGQGAPAMVLSTRGRSVEAVIAELKADPAVAYAEPNYLFSLPESDVEGGVAAPPPRRRRDRRGGGERSADRRPVLARPDARARRLESVDRRVEPRRRPRHGRPGRAPRSAWARREGIRLRQQRLRAHRTTTATAPGSLASSPRTRTTTTGSPASAGPTGSCR